MGQESAKAVMSTRAHYPHVSRQTKAWKLPRTTAPNVPEVDHKGARARARNIDLGKKLLLSEYSRIVILLGDLPLAHIVGLERSGQILNARLKILSRTQSVLTRT